MRISDWSSDVCSSDLRGCEQARRGDPEKPRRLAAPVGGFQSRLGDLRESRLDAIVEAEPGLGRMRLARRALDQCYADALFERRERSAHRLQGSPQMAGRRRLAALLDDCPEGPDFLQPLQFIPPRCRSNFYHR